MKTKTIKVEYLIDVPKNFTGIAEFINEDKIWYKDGEYHREDGPAVEYTDGSFPDGDEEWYLEGEEYSKINLNDYIILDHYKGKHNLTWYKLLGKDKVIEYPDIPGLITK